MALNFGQKLRPPAVAGQFYPVEKKKLEEMISGFLKKANPPKIEGDVFGLILPHAGYIFSGPVAAHGLKAISGKNFDTVIIVGDSHCEYFDGVSIWPAGFWETPLGKVEVDKQLAEKILSFSERFIVRDSAHLFEHGLEVQIPFLQKVLKDFKILPIIFGSENKDWKALARAILKNTKDKKVLIVASSDLSHYPSHEEAKKADQETLKAILTLGPQKLEKKIRELEERNIPNAQTFLCAEDSVKALMEVGRNLGAEAKLLKYANSGDTAGDKSRVVGYGAVAVYKRKTDGLNREEKEELLKIAKTSVESLVQERRIPEFGVKSERLKESRGAFVTIKKNGQLRGCIGQIIENGPLTETVSRMAVAAASEDYRFEPITKEELPELEYEISILSPLKKINSSQEIRLGVQGVLAVAGSKTGLFLPQVAEENHWDTETLLENLMLKAGVQPDYWKKNPVDFYTFEADIIKQ